MSRRDWYVHDFNNSYIRILCCVHLLLKDVIYVQLIDEILFVLQFFVYGLFMG